MINLKEFKKLNEESSGYLGDKRNEVEEERNWKFGKGNWQLGWVCGENSLEYEEICQLYEDAYYYYFLSRPDLLEYLVNNASDVYDDDVSNVKSGLDYKKKGEIRTHIQDIAIRRCLFRFGKSFKGKELVQIRDMVGKDPISKALSPGQVPFHRLDLIVRPSNLSEIYKKRWWLMDSVEDFYQCNKRLFVKK